MVSIPGRWGTEPEKATVPGELTSDEKGFTLSTGHGTRRRFDGASDIGRGTANEILPEAFGTAEDGRRYTLQGVRRVSFPETTPSQWRPLRVWEGVHQPNVHVTPIVSVDVVAFVVAHWVDAVLPTGEAPIIVDLRDGRVLTMPRERTHGWCRIRYAKATPLDVVEHDAFCLASLGSLIADVAVSKPELAATTSDGTIVRNLEEARSIGEPFFSAPGDRAALEAVIGNWMAAWNDVPLVLEAVLDAGAINRARAQAATITAVLEPLYDMMFQVTVEERKAWKARRERILAKHEGDDRALLEDRLRDVKPVSFRQKMVRLLEPLQGSLGFESNAIQDWARELAQVRNELIHWKQPRHHGNRRWLVMSRVRNLALTLARYHLWRHLGLPEDACNAAAARYWTGWETWTLPSSNPPPDAMKPRKVRSAKP